MSGQASYTVDLTLPRDIVHGRGGAGGRSPQFAELPLLRMRLGLEHVNVIDAGTSRTGVRDEKVERQIRRTILRHQRY